MHSGFPSSSWMTLWLFSFLGVSSLSLFARAWGMLRGQVLAGGQVGQALVGTHQVRSLTSRQTAAYLSRTGGKTGSSWSGRWGSNPRRLAWKASALPLSYTRLAYYYRQSPGGAPYSEVDLASQGLSSRRSSRRRRRLPPAVAEGQRPGTRWPSASAGC